MEKGKWNKGETSYIDIDGKLHHNVNAENGIYMDYTDKRYPRGRLRKAGSASSITAEADGGHTSKYTYQGITTVTRYDKHGHVLDKTTYKA